MLSGTRPSVCLSVCLYVHPHLSLFAKAFRGCPHKSVRQMGGRLFTCHLRDAQTTQSAAHNAACLNLMKPKWRIDAAPRTAQILWRIPRLSVSTFCRAALEELCIFYLSLEIRLDSDESIGCTRRHTLSLAHIWAHTQMGLLLLLKSRQLWRERGGTVGICICRWEKKLHLPQGPAVEMNQLSMVCRSDPILLITKSQNNKDQKVVGRAVCSSFVVP